MQEDACGPITTAASEPVSNGAPKDQTNHNVQKPNPKDCVGCHGFDPGQKNPSNDPKLFEFSGIRPGSTPDYDGDGNIRESVQNEIQGLEAILLQLIELYAANTIGVPIAYDAHAYPYFLKATGGSYRDFNATLLKAAYNYHTSIKEPGGFIHNSLYIAQLLVDSIRDLGGNAAPYTWR